MTVGKAPYQSVPVDGLGYLSAGGVFSGHEAPRLRMYLISFGGWHQTLP